MSELRTTQNASRASGTLRQGIARLTDWLRVPRRLCRRSALLPILWARAHVIRTLRAPVPIYAVDCSANEIADLSSVDAALLHRSGAAVGYFLSVSRTLPSMRIVCAGSAAKLERFPRVLCAPWFAKHVSGVWRRELRTILIFAGRQVSIRALAIHELAHALLDLWSDGFAYPPALHEAYAMLCQHWVVGLQSNSSLAQPSVADDTRRGRADRAREPLPIKDLICFAPRADYREEPEGYMTQYRGMMRDAVYLAGFLSQLQVSGSPVVYRILPTLREADVQEPEKVYEVVVSLCGLPKSELEARFRAYSCQCRK